MTWLAKTLERLAASDAASYQVGESPFSEPTALAALALAAHGRAGDASRLGDSLAAWQQASGSVGISPMDAEPGWPTALAILAWTEIERDLPRAYETAIKRASNWLLGTRGKTAPLADDTGHDTLLTGWPWVEGTHSWLEPTAHAALALGAAGKNGTPRALEAQRLLVDRLLPGGGCNYGNTIVLGQALRPHVLPTGVALTALSLPGAPEDRRVALSLEYLESAIGPETTADSLAWATIGLAAHGRRPHAADLWLERAAQRASERGRQNSCVLVALASSAARPWACLSIATRQR